MSHRLLQEEVLCGPILRSMYNIREEKSPVNEQNAPISDFPGGTVGGSLPANAGGTGSAPGPGAFHLPWSNGARVPQLLSPRCRAQAPRLSSLLQLLEPAHPEPVLCTKRSHPNKKPAHTMQSSLRSPQLKPVQQQRLSATQNE